MSASGWRVLAYLSIGLAVLAYVIHGASGTAGWAASTALFCLAIESILRALSK